MTYADECPQPNHFSDGGKSACMRPAGKSLLLEGSIAKSGVFARWKCKKSRTAVLAASNFPIAHKSGPPASNR